MKNVSDLLMNYNNLVARIDDLCAGIQSACGDNIQCRKGCDSCCRHFSIFWVEAVSMAHVLAEMPSERFRSLRQKAQSFAEHDVCPLLEDGVCALYSARPIICRTHGLPILTRNGTAQLIDFCPQNFVQAETISGKWVIDLDQLNNTLAAINALFVTQYFNGTPPPTERLTIADALFLQV
ncbi:MAG: YkgJ family cysteine cluster protein [Geobacteraceae bacterium]|nr:YkgJ family cysteine cluster protein [Geobacteraceae bacterium]